MTGNPIPVPYHNRTGQFNAGTVIALPLSLDIIKSAQSTVRRLLDRHVSGDWGEIDRSQRNNNLRAIEAGTGAIDSVYILPPFGHRLVITTHLDEGKTHLIAPEVFPW